MGDLARKGLRVKDVCKILSQQALNRNIKIGFSNRDTEDVVMRKENVKLGFANVSGVGVLKALASGPNSILGVAVGKPGDITLTGQQMLLALKPFLINDPLLVSYAGRGNQLKISPLVALETVQIEPGIDALYLLTAIAKQILTLAAQENLVAQN